MNYELFMPRLAAIFTLMLVLLIAVQPVFAFHYCSGRLVSVEVPTPDHGQPCCPDTHHDGDTGGDIIKDSCCHTSLTALATDDYMHQETSGQQVIPAGISAFLLFTGILSRLTPEPSGSPWHNNTPPPYLPAKGKDILTRFCVYII